MRSISQTLLDAQQSTKRRHYIRVVINTVDYSDRVLFIEQHEEPYNDWTDIILDNSDNGLAAVSTQSVNLLGRRFKIGYGFVTIVGNEYDGSETPDIWVKKQQLSTSSGQRVCTLHCEGQWSYLKEQRLMALGSPPSTLSIVDPANVGSDPYYVDTFNATHTIYELIEMIIEGVFGWTLNPPPIPDDGILTGPYKPIYTLSEMPTADIVLRDLISMTQCYLKPKANLTWDIVYPQISDSTNATYYASSHPHFYDYGEVFSLVIPNKIVVFGNTSGQLPWQEPIIAASTPNYAGNYTEVMEPEVDVTITTQTDAENRAAVLLTRLYMERQMSGYLIADHDCRLELYDKIAVIDS